MPKRKRQSVHRSSQSKCVKAEKESSFRLLDLPTEILDLILEDALYFPQIRQTSVVYSASITDTLSSNILRSCSFLRQKCLQMIKDEFAWIRIGSTLPDIFSCILSNQIFIKSRVPGKWRHMFEHTVSTLDVFIGLSNPTATSDRIMSSSKKSALLPFTHRAWLEVLECLQRSFSELDRFGVANLALRCNSLSPAMGRVIDRFIMPSFLKLRAFNRVGFHGVISDRVSRREAKHMTEGLGLDAHVKDLMTLFGQVADLGRSGLDDDAQLLALFSYSRINMCGWCPPASYVRFPRMHSENEPPRVYQSGIALLYFHLEITALRKYVDLYERHGIEWAQENYDHLTDEGYRWNRVFMELGFSLRHENRRRLLMNIAVALRMEARIADGVDVGEDEAKILQDDAIYAEEIGHAETFVDVASKMLGNHEDVNEFGRPIDPNKTLLEALSDRERDQYVEFHNVQGTGFYWAGHKDMLEVWGGETALRYLPRAAESAAGIDTRRRLANSELIPEVRYCGKECNCIVF